MPWTWQNTASLPHFSSSGKTWEVPITQAFQLYRKSRLGCLCLGFVVSSCCRFYCPQSCRPWDTDLARSLPVCQGRTGPPTTTPTHAKPSPGWAAHPLLQCSACSFAIGLFHLDSQTTRFTSYKSPNIIWVLTGNTANVHQKLFSSKQQITHMEKKLHSG